MSKMDGYKKEESDSLSDVDLDFDLFEQKPVVNKER